MVLTELKSVNYGRFRKKLNKDDVVNEKSRWMVKIRNKIKISAGN